MWRLRRRPFNRLPSCLQRRLAEHLLWQAGGPARYDYILTLVQAAIQGRTGAEYHFRRGLRLVVARDHLTLFAPRGRGAWRGSVREYERANANKPTLEIDHGKTGIS